MRYLAFVCHLKFAEPVRFTVNPLFMMRSVLGNSLRHECCLDLKRKCRDCEDSEHCTYCRFFEGVTADNSKGMKMQAYSLHQLEDISFRNRYYEEFSFRIIIYGDSAVSFYPYVYLAMVNAGKRGLGKNRIPFDFQVVETGLVRKHDSLSPADSAEEWSEAPEDYRPFSGQILLDLITPLRFQYKGHYGLDFTDEEFFRSLTRRMSGMLRTFGKKQVEMRNAFERVYIERRRLRWSEYSHYSARQNGSMQLGGATGSVVLCGDFSSCDMMVLDFIDRFSAGKNVVFGLGNIEVWKRGE